MQNLMQSDFDVLICGAGPVGLALAAMLTQRGIAADRLALIDGKTLAQTASDPRTIALSYGSRQALDALHAWPIAHDPIREIHISRRGHFGRTLIEAPQMGVPELGYVCRYGELVTRLSQVCTAAAIPTMRPCLVTGIAEAADSVNVSLGDGRTVSTALLVQAEGGLFHEQADRARRRDYQQTAIVASVSVSQRQATRAFERFTEEGPLALLPQGDGYALVWCMRPQRAQSMLLLSDDAFLSALQHTFGRRLGEFTAVGKRSAYPLGLNAQPASSARTVAIGNAAQTLHPVAGQGLNLGLRDAVVLADLLRKMPVPLALQNFIRRRSPDRRLTLRLTDVMARAFASAPDGARSQSFLGYGLGLIDAAPPLKRLLAGQMMFGWR